MSAITNQTRTSIARELLAAMLQGLCSAQVHPLYTREFGEGIQAAPKLAVQLTDMLMRELDATEKRT